MTKNYLKFGRDRNRELVRIKFNHICQDCGRKWNGEERRFDCHHIDGCGIKTRSYDRISTLGDIILLCHSCHISQESVVKKLGVKEPDPEKRKIRNFQIMELLNNGVKREKIAKQFRLSLQSIYMIKKLSSTTSKKAWYDCFIDKKVDII